MRKPTESGLQSVPATLLLRRSGTVAGAPRSLNGKRRAVWRAGARTGSPGKGPRATFLECGDGRLERSHLPPPLARRIRGTRELQVVGVDHLAFDHRHRAEDDVLQLADVADPGGWQAAPLVPPTTGASGRDRSGRRREGKRVVRAAGCRREADPVGEQHINRMAADVFISLRRIRNDTPRPLRRNARISARFHQPAPEIAYRFRYGNAGETSFTLPK